MLKLLLMQKEQLYSGIVPSKSEQAGRAPEDCHCLMQMALEQAHQAPASSSPAGCSQRSQWQRPAGGLRMRYETDISLLSNNNDLYLLSQHARQRTYTGL